MSLNEFHIDLGKLLEQGLGDVDETISDHDGMLSANNREHYFAVGRRAVRCIRLALIAAQKQETEVHSILDLPCGWGRVLRMLRAVFPAAKITACDIQKDGVDFCAHQFGATPVYSTKSAKHIPLTDQFDLIWCGSLLTHLSIEGWRDFLTFFANRLADDGLLIFTVHGTPAVKKMREGWTQLNPQQRQELLACYDEDGFGYTGHLHDPSYGFSLTRPSRCLALMEENPTLNLVSYIEGGWGIQDAVCCRKVTLTS